MSQKSDSENTGDSRGYWRPAKKCSWCGQTMRPKAVLCVNCGFDRRTGKRLQKSEPALETEVSRFRRWTSHLSLGLLVAALFPIGFTAAGLTVIWLEAQPLLFFNPVDGVVIASRVGEEWDAHENQTWYFTGVYFRYEVNGKVYNTGQYRLRVGNEAGSYESHRKIAAQYPIGTKVQGWYDPSDPRTAVMHRGIGWGGFFFLGFGVLIAVIMIKEHRDDTRGGESPNETAQAPG